MGMRNKEAVNPENVMLWYDMERGKHMMIHNDTGNTKQVFKTGELIRHCDPTLTGVAKFQERVEYAKDHPEFTPYFPPSLDFRKEHIYYTPIGSKFDGYYQLRCPKGTPYHNQLQELKSDKRRINKWISFSKTNLNPAVSSNKTLYDKKSGDVKVLTASLHHLNEYSKPNHGDKLDFNQEIQRMRKKAKHLRVEKEPNLTIFEQTQSKIKQKMEDDIRKEKEEKEAIEKAKPVNITTVRYRSKVNDVKNKTVNFTSVDNKTFADIDNFTKLKTKASFDVEALTSKIQQYQTTTYDKRIHFKYDTVKENQFHKIKPVSMYEKKAKVEAMEMKGFEIEEPPEKTTVITKMRFNSKILSDGQQYDNDRKLMMKFHPELYEIKENKSIKMKAPLEVQKKKEILEQAKSKQEIQ